MTKFERDELYRTGPKSRSEEPPRNRTRDETDNDPWARWSADQKAVWERELTYWESTAAGDADRFMTLWDDRFVEWPDDEETPITVADLRPNVADRFEEVRSNEFSYALDPLAIVVSGDVGIAYYRARTELRDGDGEETAAYRMTHTWRKRGSEWKIIGGMSAPIPGR